MAIEYVGRKTTSGNGVSSATLNLSSFAAGETTPATIQEGDLVVVVLGRSSTSNLTLSLTTSGYTKLLDIYSDDSVDANMGVFYKFMGSTPDTTVAIPAGNNNDGYVFEVFVFRGVDQTTPVDVTTLSASGINGANINPPSITPVTDGAWLLVGGVNTYGSAPSASPSGITNEYIDATFSPTRQAGSAVAQVRNCTGGVAVNIGQWTYSGDTADSWASFALALRPAPSGGKIKVHNGTSFVAKPVKWWNGSAWVEKPLKRWNGSAWVKTNY